MCGTANEPDLASIVWQLKHMMMMMKDKWKMKRKIKKKVKQRSNQRTRLKSFISMPNAQCPIWLDVAVSFHFQLIKRRKKKALNLKIISKIQILFSSSFVFVRFLFSIIFEIWLTWMWYKLCDACVVFQSSCHTYLAA